MQRPPACAVSIRMVSSRFQAPCAFEEALDTVDIEPLEISILFSFPSAMNARKRLSGDQNIVEARSVPDSGRGTTESMGRIHIVDRPFFDARNARSDPSGETAGGAGIRTVPSGAETVNRIVRRVAGGRRAERIARARSKRTLSNAAAEIHTIRVPVRDLVAAWPAAQRRCRRAIPAPWKDPGRSATGTPGSFARHFCTIRSKTLCTPPSASGCGSCFRIAAITLAAL